MAKLLKLRRGTTTQHNSFTGAEGEVTVDTDKETLVVHDGSTAGGHPVAAEDMANVSAADIKGRLGTTLTNAEINASAAIAGTKIAPDFGSQNIVTTGAFNSGSVTITGGSPAITFTDSNNDPDYYIQNNNGALRIYDATNSAERFVVNTDGHVDVTGNLDAGAGVDVTGNITVTGTVDGVDIAALNTSVGNLGISGGAIASATTATTQSAGDNSTKVATTAYTDTAVSNLVDSSPAALNTLNELAAALGDDANFSTTVNNTLATKLPKSGGEMSGDLTVHDVVPDGDSSRNLGTNTVRFANVYADNFVGAGTNLTGIESFVTGMILLWSGASNAIPSGFVLCDGNNSTPDLRNRFVIGAGDTYSVDGTGGSATINSNVNHSHSTPDHSHAMNGHTHSISGSVSGNTGSGGSHSHTIPSFFGNNSSITVAKKASSDDDYYQQVNVSTNSGGSHSHSFSGNFSGNSGGANGNTTSSGGSNTGNSGSGSTVSVLNPYYALCYIMKT